jgi:hypothetical protein
MDKNNMEYRQFIINEFNKMQYEILNVGWNNIKVKYHPDNNLDNPRAFELYELYRDVYEGMKERLEMEEQILDLLGDLEGD